MLEYSRHIPSQLPVIAAMGRTIGNAVVQRLGKRSTHSAEEAFAVVDPRPRRLIDDYLRHIGAEPGDYAGKVPAHLFPQWSFPVQARCLSGINYPLARILNAGCKLTIHEELPDHQPLEVTAQVTGIDDNGRRVLIHQCITTRTANAPRGVVAEMTGLIPLRSERGGTKEPKVVPPSARRIDTWELRRGDGLDFALLTGDFNPVHWIPLYARGMGFKSNILHGFSSMARAIESLRRHLVGMALRTFDFHFTRPLVLPATVHVFVDDTRLFVGDAPGERAYLIASFATEN